MSWKAVFIFIVVLAFASILPTHIAEATHALIETHGALVSYDTGYYPHSFNGSVNVVIQDGDTFIRIADTRLIPSEGVKCSGSMKPMLGCGNTLIFEKITEATALNEGDIITFIRDENDESGVIHQLVEITDDCYRFKGLNNNVDDGCVPRENFVYRLVAIVFTGEN